VGHDLRDARGESFELADEVLPHHDHDFHSSWRERRRVLGHFTRRPVATDGVPELLDECPPQGVVPPEREQFLELVEDEHRPHQGVVLPHLGDREEIPQRVHRRQPRCRGVTGHDRVGAGLGGVLDRLPHEFDGGRARVVQSHHHREVAALAEWLGHTGAQQRRLAEA